jgi:hypothetical protein
MSEKYTEMEKALMEGGHSVDYKSDWPFVKEAEKPFSFLKDLHESRMTRNENNAKVLTYTDCCERAYLSMLILQLFRNYPKYLGIASVYAKRTEQRDYNTFRTNATDLYNFMYYVNGSDKALEKLKDPISAKSLANKTYVPLTDFYRFIVRLKNSSPVQVNDQEVFIKFESALKITNSDYKSIRRDVFNWKRLSDTDRKKLTTRLLLATRAKLRSSDLIDDLEALANEKNLETSTVVDNEPTVSVPDITVTAEDLVVYRLLVGSKNMAMAKKFLELAKDGKSIPQQMVQAYLPVIELVDDIVKAGPAYVQMLRQLQNRAKKSSKK